MIDFTSKRALIFGVASEDSIAWAINNLIIEAGGTTILSYQKRFKSRILQLTKDIDGIEAIEECDVAFEDQVKDLFNRLTGKFDMVVHAIGFAPATALMKPIIFTTEEDFNTALVISSYSLLRIARHAMRVLNPNSSFITLTYLGATKVVSGYRLMGVAKATLESMVRELSVVLGAAGHRINAVSSGPIRTLAASHIPGFDNILDYMARTAPLKRNVTQDDTAKASIFLLSDMASGITGQTIFVDLGFNIIGVPPNLDN
ncbi:MAG: Enoyl-[acyl-carrier-protein] reductase [NADH] FabI [Candidatus Heimdallarchaeota archaeon LC_2]|nr:MAG: Enoyl-[acyl-carrier-protein] reductase [NADH] FabI [Candidatus Heimdallarchaeota archaeon LC_2]